MTNTNTMLHVEQAAFILAKKFPKLERCVDYWVSHPVDEKTLKQTKSAWVPIWYPRNIPQPTPVDLLNWWPEFAAEYELMIGAPERVRTERDALLAEADRLVERAADAGDADREAALRRYRAALRDVPQQAGFPLDVVWPQLPA